MMDFLTSKYSRMFRLFLPLFLLPMLAAAQGIGGAQIYGQAVIQDFENGSVNDLLRTAAGWSTTDQYNDANDPTRSDGYLSDGSSIIATIGGWYTSSAKYPLTYHFDQGSSDRIVFEWTQLITPSDPGVSGASDRFGWEFKDSAGQTLFSFKLVQFVDTNGNGDWDPASNGNPAEPLATPADDQDGGNPLFVPNKLLVVGYDASGNRLPTSEMANYVQVERGSWYKFKIIADLKNKKWHAQIQNGSSYSTLTTPEGASIPAGAGSLNQMSVVWELNDTTHDGDLYSMGGTNQMLFDDLKISGRKVVTLGLIVPAMAPYDGAARGATVSQDPAGVALVSYSVRDSNGNYNALSNLPRDAGQYRVSVSVSSPYFAVSASDPASADSQTLSGDYRITTKSVSITGLTANDKAYNGTVYGSLSGTPSLAGVVPGDAVSLVGTPNVQFATMAVGTGIAVSINGGLSLTGAQAANYQLTLPTFVANIYKADPIVRAPAASNINYGQTLAGSAFIGGSSSVAGAFAWRTPSAVLSAGTSSQDVVFTPSDTANYNAVTTSVSVTVNKVTPTITAVPVASDIVYGQNLGSSILSAGAGSVAGNFAWTTPSTVLAAGNRTQGVTFTPSDAANYNSVTTSVGVKVNKAVPTITTAPTPSVITYNATRTLANVGLSGGVGSVPGIFSWQNSATVLVAGTSTQRAVFNPSENSNYESVTIDLSVTVDKATPLISQTPTAGTIVYGQNLGSSVLTGGVGTVSGNFVWTNPSLVLPAGNTPQEVTFRPDDQANYNTVTASLYVRVNKATPTITTIPMVAPLTYGQTLTESSLTGGEASVAGSFGWTTASTKPSAGSSSQSLTFTPSDTANFNPVTTLVTISVEKATPVMSTIPTSSQINYGQTLDSSSLSGGVASVGGRFAWRTPSAVLSAGTSSQDVVFTPSDTANYNAVTTSVSVTVNKVTPTITAVPVASDIVYGQNLGSSILSAGAGSVAGNFAWTTPSTVLAAGNRTQGVTFTPSDAANYNSVTTSVGVKVNKAVPTITTAPTPSVITYNATRTLANVGLSGGVGSVPGIFSWQNSATVLVAGTSTQRAVFNPSENSNYESVTIDLSVTVNKATPTITSSPVAAQITYGQTLVESSLTGGVASVPGAFAWTTSSATPSAGTIAQSVTFTPSDTINYNTVTTSVNIKVNKAVPTVSVVPTASAITQGQALSSSVLTGGSVTGVGGASVAGSFAFTSTSTVPAVGTGNQSVTFTPSGSDATNYSTATVNIPVTVIRATTPAEDYLSGAGLSGSDADLAADPDNDGLTNAVEFAFGLNPKSGSGQPILVKGDKIIFLERNSGVTYAVKHAPDLGANWVGVSTLPTPSVSQPVGTPTGYTQYELRMDTTGTGARDFYKVDATIQ